jgi:hypothetical protein
VQECRVRVLEFAGDMGCRTLGECLSAVGCGVWDCVGGVLFDDMVCRSAGLGFWSLGVTWGAEF